MRFHTILLVAGAAITVNCGGGPQVQPSPVTEDPIVTCPSDIAVTAHSGLNPTVSYDVPVAAKGAPPVRVACTPPSGTAFTSGVTGVTCEATDSRQRTASCSFSVVVTAIPQLTKTRLMAFGDSLTEGKTSLIARGVVVTPGTFNTNVSYVEQLDKKIRDRYQDQFVTIIAYGSGGESAGAGKIRLRDNWGTFNPEVLLLLEGVNDLLASDTGTVAGMNSAMDSVIDALRTMIQFAKDRGAQVFVATLLPMTRPRAANVIAAVPTLNSRIRALAAEKNVPLVDLYAAVPTALIGSDGLHPVAQAYDVIADEWLKAIIATLEVKPSPPQ